MKVGAAGLALALVSGGFGTEVLSGTPTGAGAATEPAPIAARPRGTVTGK